MTTKSYMRFVRFQLHVFVLGSQLIWFFPLDSRQVMEIKPAWLLEGVLFEYFEHKHFLKINIRSYTVAPHYFKPADLEQLAQGDKKMPKTIGASSSSTITT